MNYTYTNDYYLHTVQDEGGHQTSLTRDPTTHRITRIDYPDGGYETFTYNSFGQVLTHRMTTGGTETFTYDSRGLKQDYRNPSNATGNPTARYQYDAYDRVAGVTDALGVTSGDVNHTTNFAYNLRGQVTVTTLPTDPGGGRHTIVNAYNLNGDGTVVSVTDQLGHVTSYTYDEYRRVRTVTPPVRGTGDGYPHTTEFSYYVYGGDDYRNTDSNVAWIELPSGKWINMVYDDNRRKTGVTVGWGTTDAATTGYTYDNVGNLIKVTKPLTSHIITTVYDERNRPSSVSDALAGVTTFKYDLSGRKLSVTRPNGQLTTFNSYDAMNRVLQQTATQSPDPPAVTKYTYTQAGLLWTMQDPRLVALNSSYNYKYDYDTTGRKTKVTYPPDSAGVQRTEQFTYDTAGRLQTFKNRNDKTQTFTYDALNRMTGFSWNDGVTPSVTFGYDIGSRLIAINNANATISRTYWNDNLLYVETETILGRNADTMTYVYDADGNRQLAQWGFYVQNRYTYTGRNQLQTLLVNAIVVATYAYDVNGNLTTRTPDNSTSSTYTYDALDRVTHITHSLTGDTRTFDYAYDNVGNRKWTKRDGGTGDVFGYDYADQVTAVKFDVPNPDTTPVGAQTIVYDANGNRTSFSAYGPTDTYALNNLNQYTSRNNSNAAYDNNGNLTVSVNGSSYTYDAQNRLTSAYKNGTTETFQYDGLNRQVSRTVDGATTYNVYDGWDLMGEYANGATFPSARYTHGVSGLVKDVATNNYYYQDGSGSTSHLADGGGALLEWYRYDLQGTPIFYNAADVQISGSNWGVRHLFTGQQWYSELGLYDLRNRFYSPDIGRLLQPDPIGFWGDPTNPYRYCGNNPVNRRDPSGLQDAVSSKFTYKTEDIGGESYTPLGENGGYTMGPSGPSLGYDMSGSGGPSLGGTDLPSGGWGPGPTFGFTINGGGDFGDHGFGGGGENDGERGGGGFHITRSVRQAVVVTLPYGTSYIPMTTVKNPAQARVLGVFVDSAVPIFVPPGEDPQAEVNFWRANATDRMFNLPMFALAFMPKGPNDFAFNISPIYDAYGNFLYGASGQATGISPALLQAVGAAIHGGQNNPANIYDIQSGIDAVRMGGIISVVPVGFTDF